MCGIVGAVANRDIVPVLLTGLKRLEYRGYDSCGVAVYQNGIRRARSVARVADLDNEVRRVQLTGTTGISHTRWATHGAPLTANAHPHFSQNAGGEPHIALVHNGIVENHEELRSELQARGYVFTSQTDTEAIAHLIHSLYEGDLLRAVQQAVKRLEGAFAFAVFCKNEPDRIIGVRHNCPLIVGIGDGENFLASDALALAGSSNQIIFLEEGDIVDMRRDSVHITNKNDVAVTRKIHTVNVDTSAIELGPYRHFMQKEIFEQPQAVAHSIDDVQGFDCELFGNSASEVFKKIDAIQILACGTSFHAGMTAKYWLESIAGIPTNVEVASEYRYRKPFVNPNALALVISQSGETADTLAALKYALELGHRHSMAICNVATSAMVRETELCFLTRAGVEIGVASTKAFTTQLVALILLTLTLAKMRGRLTEEGQAEYLKRLRLLPAALQGALALESQVIGWAEAFSRRENALFLGRGVHYPIALEGALKLKEISYIHAEAFPAGELKHGPLALVTSEMPVAVVAPNDTLIEKLKSNMHEVRSRGGELYVLADADSRISCSDGVHVIRMPGRYGILSPILHVVPLQLLAYHTALARKTDVDKPRNLAKSVTVE